ncbi:MAG: hypothetical protein EOP05_23740 [Proteobacteria bacterium]|nr:MAG: hypothetical protein EOP05_23740 [Pseudomonadota bacterium]
MAKISTTKSRILKPGGVDEYIAKWPAEVQTRLLEMRSAVQSVVPDALETTSYFDMPGYSYPGYSYNGMFAWFSYKAPLVRLHVRPEAITRNVTQRLQDHQSYNQLSYRRSNPEGFGKEASYGKFKGYEEHG